MPHIRSRSQIISFNKNMFMMLIYFMLGLVKIRSAPHGLEIGEKKTYILSMEGVSEKIKIRESARERVTK